MFGQHSNLFTVWPNCLFNFVDKINIRYKWSLPSSFPESRTNCGINIANVKLVIRFKVLRANSNVNDWSDHFTTAPFINLFRNVLASLLQVIILAVAPNYIHRIPSINTQ